MKKPFHWIGKKDAQLLNDAGRRVSSKRHFIQLERGARPVVGRKAADATLQVALRNSATLRLTHTAPSSLFAFGIARHACVASVAMVSNAVDHTGEQFDTGPHDDGLRILEGIARAARSFLATT